MDNNLANIVELTLNNGLTVWLSSNKSVPKVYGCVVVKAGAKHSPNTGIAHYFEHIMFKGTKQIGTIDYEKEAPLLEQIEQRYSQLKEAKTDKERASIQMEINALNVSATQYAIPNDFNNLISKYGGSELNAGTSYDYTIFHNTFTPEYLEHWCMLNSERLIDPIFRLFQSELETVYEEKNMYADNMGATAMQKVLERIASPHPYCYPIIGSTEALKNPDMRAMKSFFETYYKAGNMCLILVGNFDNEQITSLLERTFGRIKPGNVPENIFPKPHPFYGTERMNIKLPIPLVGVGGLFWHTIPNNHKDNVALEFIKYFLSNEGKTGRLDRLVLDSKMMESTAFSIGLNDMGCFAIQVYTKPFRSISKALKQSLNQLEEIKNGHFTEQELMEAKLSFRKMSILKTEDPEKLKELLVDLYSNNQTWSSFLNILEMAETLTKQDIVDVANRYLNNNKLEIIKQTGNYTKEKIAKPPYQPVTSPNRHSVSIFAQKLATLPTQKAELQILDFHKDIDRLTLSTNGLARLFKTQNTNNDLFTLDLIYYRQPYRHPRQDILDEYLDRVGGMGLNSEELNRKLQGLGATVTYESKDSFFVISISGFDDYFDETISLVGGFLFSINAEPKQIKQILEAKKIVDKAMRKDTSSISKRVLDIARYGEEKAPHMVSISTKELRHMRVNMLVEELKMLLKSEVDIHYTGSLTIDNIAPKVATAFHVKEVNAPSEGFRYLEATDPQSPQLYYFYTPAKEASQIVLWAYIPLGNLSKEERIVLQAYDAYIGKGMGSLLFQEIREYQSLAYGVGGYANLPPYNMNEKAVDYIIYMSTQADKITQAIDLLEKLIRHTPNDNSRFEYAKNELLSTFRGLYPTQRMKSRTIVSMERQGYERDASLVMLDELNRITIGDIIAFHKKHILGHPLTLTLVGNISKEYIQCLGNRYSIHKVNEGMLIH